ncbi:hypothetical protein [Pseudomonas sp. zfem003]|uniref:hypothetical protein n=1 Tax=Pseudomonadaceae TaxID=135621 RepID=UPI00292A0E45|nr:hypothetical protein [Pseudomonas sp. zfem003]MDU9397350.1 hypothetical protein [Pseudomonas sp. zfem003]
MDNPDQVSTYHGTNDLHANDIVEGNIDATLGGGELGMGFYLGTALHVAKAWAAQMHGCETVVEFQFSDKEFWKFDIEALTDIEALEKRHTIRSRGLTRSYLFLKDVVWAPIVGGPKVYSDQHKWESKEGEDFLNSDQVMRRKI